MSETIQTIDATEYERQVLSSSVPVVLDFFSTECPPCEALAPKFEAVAAGYEGKVRFLKMFRQGNKEIAAALGVSGSPTLVFFKAGKEVGSRLSGDIKRSEIKLAVEAMLG